MHIFATQADAASFPDANGLKAQGFDACLLRDFCLFTDEPSRVTPIAERLRAAGLRLLLDAELDRFPMDHPLVSSAPDAFALRRHLPGDGAVDPRVPGPPVGEARARLKSAGACEQLMPALRERLIALVKAGADGFRILRPDAADPGVQRELFARLRGEAPGLVFIAQTPGVPRDRAMGLAGFDYLVSSFSHWDEEAAWLAEEYEALRTIAPLLAEVVPDAAHATGGAERDERRMLLAAATANGVIVSQRTPAAVARALSLADQLTRFGGEMRFIPIGPVTAILRCAAPDARLADEAALILVNHSNSAPALAREHDILGAAGTCCQHFRRVEGNAPPFAPLAPGEVRLLLARRGKAIAGRRHGGAKAAQAAAARPRLVIDAISPDVDGGAFPAKRTIGDIVAVEANIFGDGHEQLAAELRWRATDEKSWRSVRMQELGNDRWGADLPLERLGRHEFVIEAWLDIYGGFCRDFRKKLDAGVAEPVNYLEGRAFVGATSRTAPDGMRKRLEGFLALFDSAGQDEQRAAILLDPELALLMDEADERPFSIATATRPVDAERLAARFSSWYELFPRSQTDDPRRHGTFDDVIGRMPAIRAMGFDTLYLTPIHPIGRKHRKGRNNAITAAEDDPGSPYAIGSDEGGHDAIHPELGTLKDFRRMVAAAHDHGLEIALDFAIQCSPDHPWLKEHPGWFD